MNTYVVRSRIVWGLICVASFLGQSLLYAQPEKADEALFTRASQLAAEVENLRSVSVPAEVFRVVNNPYVIWQYQGQKFQVLDKAAQMTTQFREMTAALKRITIGRNKETLHFTCSLAQFQN